MLPKFKSFLIAICNTMFLGIKYFLEAIFLIKYIHERFLKLTFGDFFFFTRLLERLASRVCQIIEDAEGQHKVKSTSHIQRTNWFSNPFAVAHNLEDT